MKRLLLSVSTFLFLAGMSVAIAAPMVGTLDLQQVLQNSPKVAAISSDLKAKFEPQQKKIVAAQNNLQAEALKLTPKNAAKLKPAELTKLKAKVTTDRKAFQDMALKFQKDVGAAQADAMKGFMKEIDATVAQVAKDKKLDMVLMKQAVLFAKNKVDITQEVLTALPKK